MTVYNPDGSVHTSPLSNYELALQGSTDPHVYSGQNQYSAPIDYKTALATGYINQDTYNQKTAGGATGIAPGGGLSYAGVGTSDPVRNSENNITQGVLQASSDAGIKSAQDSYKSLSDLLTSRYNALGAQRDSEVSGINADYKNQGDILNDNQNKETGATSAGLARIGGFLGGSASSIGAMVNLNHSHQIDIQSLQAKKDAAIQAANDAINEKQFALAQTQLNAIQDLNKTIADRKDTFFSQMMQLNSQSLAQDANTRANSEFASKQANDYLTSIIAAGQTPSSADIASLSKSLNLSPDTTLHLVQAKQASFQLETSSKKSDEDVKIINALSNIPQGKFVSIGGKTYEGLQKPAAGAAQTVTNEDKINFVNNLLVPGNTIPGTKAVPFLDAHGLLTPEGLTAAIKASQLPRKTVLAEIGSLVALGKDKLPLPSYHFNDGDLKSLGF